MQGRQPARSLGWYMIEMRTRGVVVDLRMRDQDTIADLLKRFQERPRTLVFTKATEVVAAFTPATAAGARPALTLRAPAVAGVLGLDFTTTVPGVRGPASGGPGCRPRVSEVARRGAAIAFLHGGETVRTLNGADVAGVDGAAFKARLAGSRRSRGPRARATARSSSSCPPARAPHVLAAPRTPTAPTPPAAPRRRRRRPRARPRSASTPRPAAPRRSRRPRRPRRRRARPAPTSRCRTSRSARCSRASTRGSTMRARDHER